MKKSDEPIVVELTVSADVETVWAALTEPEKMRDWFFADMPDFKAEVGFATRFEIINDARTFPHVWEVVKVEPLKTLVMNWTYDGYEGSAKIRFEIIPGDDTNTVRLTAEAIEDFQQDIPEFTRESAVGGWDYLINEELKMFLATQ